MQRNGPAAWYSVVIASCQHQATMRLGFNHIFLPTLLSLLKKEMEVSSPDICRMNAVRMLQGAVSTWVYYIFTQVATIGSSRQIVVACHCQGYSRAVLTCSVCWWKWIPQYLIFLSNVRADSCIYRVLVCWLAFGLACVSVSQHADFVDVLVDSLCAVGGG